MLLRRPAPRKESHSMRRLVVALCSFALILVSLTSVSAAALPDLSYYSLRIPAGLTVATTIGRVPCVTSYPSLIRSATVRPAGRRIE